MIEQVIDEILAAENEARETVKQAGERAAEINLDAARIPDKIKKDFVTSINNPNKIFPPMYLPVENLLYDGKLILHIHVPSGSQVFRCSGRIYDRNHDSDVDITDVADLVYQLYARKQSSYFVNKVFPVFSVSDLRHDLIERARGMTKARLRNHP